MSNSDKKKKIIITTIVGVILLAIIIFILWFFNRKFEITFNLNNGTNDFIVQVKYNNIINEKDIKGKDDLGEKFIGWYEVIDFKDGKDVLAEKPFDFKTKINRKIKLKALYEAKAKFITITFDSRGGSKVDPITIKEGELLKLPTKPTYKGYVFQVWEDKNGTPIYNDALLAEDTTLYAKWQKKEEKISLSLTRNIIHANGNKTSTAKAKVENASGKVTYSLSSNACMTIDAKTGVITAKEKPIKGGALATYKKSCAGGAEVIVTAKTPSGKKATAKIKYEPDLILNCYGNIYEEDKRFNIDQSIIQILATKAKVNEWKVLPDDVGGKYTGKILINTANEFKSEGNKFEKAIGDVSVLATTKAGQKITTKIVFIVN